EGHGRDRTHVAVHLETALETHREDVEAAEKEPGDGDDRDRLLGADEDDINRNREPEVAEPGSEQREREPEADRRGGPLGERVPLRRSSNEDSPRQRDDGGMETPRADT